MSTVSFVPTLPIAGGSVTSLDPIPSGWIKIILGSMYSGKTGDLLRRHRRDVIAGKKCLLIKYCHDTRYDKDHLVTHDQVMEKAIISVGNSLQTTIDRISDLSTYDSVFVDEIQFFHDGAQVCDRLANQGYEVTVCGLQGDYQRQIFETIAGLIPRAEKIIHLTAIDRETHQEASLTARISKESEREVIGGIGKYLAVDRQHYLSLQQPEISHSLKVGKIHLILGPMCAGKTTEILRRMKRDILAGRVCLLVKYHQDVRHIIREDMLTHGSQPHISGECSTSSNRVIVSHGDHLLDTIQGVTDLAQYDSIYLNDIQCYPDGAQVCDLLANHGYEVTVCGLQGDNQRQIYPTIANLIPISEEILQLTAIDPINHREASFTTLIDGIYVPVDRLGFMSSHTID